MALRLSTAETSANKIDCGNIFSKWSGEFTMCAWIYVDSMGTPGVKNPTYMGSINFSPASGARLIMSAIDASTSKLVGQLNGNDSNVTGTYNFKNDTGKWIFVAYTFKPSTRQTLYYAFIGDQTVTQDAQKTASVPASVANPGNSFLLGNRSDGTIEAMNGRMAHARFYRRELNKGELEYLMRRPVLPGGRGELNGFYSGWILDNLTIATDVNNLAPGVVTATSISDVPDPFAPSDKSIIADRIAQYIIIAGNAFSSALSDSIMNAASRFATIDRLQTLGRSISDSVSVGAGRSAVLSSVRTLVRSLSDSIMYAAGRLTTFIALFPLWALRNKNSSNWDFRTKSNPDGKQSSSSTPD